VLGLLAWVAAGCQQAAEDSPVSRDKQERSLVEVKPADSPIMHRVDPDATRDCLAVQHRFPVATSPTGTLEVEFCISLPVFENAVENFGVEVEQLALESTSAADLDRQVAKRSAALAPNGFLMEQKDGELNLRVDYAGLASAASPLLAPVREALDATLPEDSSQRTRLDRYAGFIQSMTIVEPASERVTPAGRRVVVAGTTHPLETVVEGRGDCDGLAVAFASLAHGNQVSPLVLLGTEIQNTHHLFAAAGVEPAEGDLVVEIEGTPLVVYELTSRSSSNVISDNARQALLGKDVEVFSVEP
jgi:hypothetical protein